LLRTPSRFGRAAIDNRTLHLALSGNGFVQRKLPESLETSDE
jgi:hypothetical protein